jgi:hypothetical protein
MKRTVATILATVGLVACGAKSEPTKAGALYSVDASKGYYQVAKVLAVTQLGVHIRLYKNRFESRPTNVDFAGLKLGNIHDTDSLGIGHLPLTHRAFAQWHPIYMVGSAVLQDELDGYEEWKSAQGGYFGSP